LVAVIGVGVVAVVVVLALLAHGIHLGSPGGGTAAVQYGEPLNYSQIVGPAQSEQAGASGGPWTPDSVLGVQLEQSASGAGGLITGCTTLWENGSVEVAPATPAGATAGAVALWMVASVNSTGAVLLTFVNDLAGTVVASNLIVVEGSCTSTFTEFGAIPSPIVDSSVVATAAAGLGGSSFDSDYAGATQVFEVLGPFWAVLYTTCSFYAQGGNGEEFAATFYATNGTFLASIGPEPVSC
jgi:hypothetical protein